MEANNSEAIKKISDSIFMIGELLVDVSKSHISKQHCIEQIREQLNIVNDKEVWDLLYKRHRNEE